MCEIWLHCWDAGSTLNALAWSYWENVIYLKIDILTLFLDMGPKILILQLNLLTVSSDSNATLFCVIILYARTSSQNGFSSFLLFMEITDYGVDNYDIGSGFGHFGVAVEDVSHLMKDNDAILFTTVTAYAMQTQNQFNFH